MMAAHNKKRFIPYGYKLMLSYFLFVMIPVVVVGWVSYHSSVQSSREQTKQNLQGTLHQMKDNLVYKAEEARRISDQLYYDKQLQSFLRHYENGWYSFERTKKYLMPTFSNAVAVFSKPALLKVYIDNKTIPEIYSDQDPKIDPISAPGYQILYMDRLRKQSWFKGLKLPADNYRGTSYEWLQIENDVNFNNISMVRRLMDFDRQCELGMTRTIIKLSDLLEAMDYTKIGDRSSLFIMDKQGHTLASSSADGAGQIALDSLDASQYLRIEERVPGLEWQLIAMVPNTLLEASAKHVLRLTIGVAAVSMLFVLLISMLVSGYFSRRVRKIVYSLHAFKEGDFHKRIVFQQNDEFAQIADAFNTMGEHVEELIKEVYVANLHKKEAELSSLQAQINPHFLYNTLSSISRLAKFGKIDQLHQMVMGLAKFYRLTLNQGRTLISVREELEQVGAYLDIQAIKFGYRMQVFYDIQSAVLGYETVKLILQPFVENALEHALYGTSINIRVTAELEGESIVFKVIDDGLGMSRDTIAQIFTKDGVRIGYGVRNVDERIKLQYGQEFGVEIYSRLGIGTTVKITVPARHGGVRESGIFSL
ncbi:sensor histidine kinase [Paenibacillus sp. GCM10023252]|uniref:sensor histidine kinase n=1 Tax=Paenibacillus sp. GCM10023252 TaxID=3252649 RepID=UPI0036122C92